MPGVRKPFVPHNGILHLNRGAVAAAELQSVLVNHPIGGKVDRLTCRMYVNVLCEGTKVSLKPHCI